MPAAKQKTPEEEAAAEAEFIGAGEIEEDVAELEPTEVDEVIFRSKGRGFRAIMIPRHRWTAGNGEVQVTPGKTLEFGPNGEYRTSDAAEIKHLKGLQSFNREFWQVGAEPGRVPDSQPMLERVVEAGISLDIAKLDELEQEESTGFARHDVMVSIKAAKARVGKLLAEARAGQES